jgi:CheY-like chemotaxis protein
METNERLKRVLIAEDDAAIRDILVRACEGVAVSVAARDGETAREALATDAYDLLFMDWQLSADGGAELMAQAARLQPGAWRIALFTVPSVDALVSAMRSGAHDAWWVARGMEPRSGLLREWLDKPPVSKGFPPLLVSRLADSMSAKAAARRTDFFEARREFSKVLVREITRRHGLSRGDLADWMGVSVRTIQRLLSNRD